MPEDTKTRELVRSVIAEAFDQHVQALHDEIVVRVMAAIEKLEEGRQEKPVSEWLKDAAQHIESSAQQTDILKALLEGTAQFCERAAILVLRGAAAVWWQGRGFQEGDSLRTVSIDLSAGPSARAVQERVLASACASEVNHRFAEDEDRPCVLIPLMIREKVAALLYCDSAVEKTKLDSCALDVLAGTAGKWIEIQAFRKSAGTAPVAQKAVESHSQPVASQSAAPKPEDRPVPGSRNESTAERGAASAPAAIPDTSRQTRETPAPEHPSSVPDGDQELHKKARRFAKLLVDEIILYNRDKVQEGRRNRDIYDRLKDDIDKSRATYEKRYGTTSVSKFNYFTEAVVNGLAERNSALLGSNFTR